MGRLKILWISKVGASIGFKSDWEEPKGDPEVAQKTTQVGKNGRYQMSKNKSTSESPI